MRGVGGDTAALVAVIALAVGVLGVSAVGAAPAASSDGVPQTVAGTQLDPDSVLMRVAIHENGSATWSVEYRVRFDDDASQEAFAAVAANVSEDPAGFAAPFRERMTATVASAERSTGREMDLRDVRVSAREEAVPQPRGVVAYRFTWRGFAADYGDRIEAGDALDGLVLDEETTLLVEWPEGYEAASVAPAPEDDGRSQAAAWSGPLAFGADEPSVTLSAPGGLPVPLPAIGAAVVAVVFGGVVVWRRRGRAPEGEGTSAGEATTTGEATTASTPTAGTHTPSGAASESADAGATGADDGFEDDGSRQPAGNAGGEATDPELLSNAERVLRLLGERGGRMKQQDIVSTLEWTEAKTSRVVADLRESGDAEVFRLGRENVVSLPDDDREGSDES